MTSEIFITVIIAYLYREAERTTYIAVMLFLLTAVIDVPTVFVAFLHRHLGAGLMGSMFNLPVIIYCEQAIFFAGGHAHGTMFGVRGNIALASIRVRPASWARCSTSQ